MKAWQKVGILTLFVLMIAGIRIYFLWRSRQTPIATQQKAYQQWVPSSDDVVKVRKLYIDDIKSAKELIGKSVWTKAGYQLAYFPYKAGRIDFSHQSGVLPAAEKLQVKEIAQQAAPASIQDRIEHGAKQIFIVFRKGDDKQDYAAPIGYAQGSDMKFYSDDLFYYDDPHELYKHWSADIWKAVDAHQAIVGMNELQASMALGQVQESDSSNIGNRTIHYTADGKSWVVSFSQDKATSVKQE